MRAKKELSKLVRISKEPKLDNPVLVAAWPGISNVALEAAEYLKDNLGAEEFAEIEALPFFDLTQVSIENNQVQPPRFPRSLFYYWRNELGGNDLIIFISEAQPSWQNYEFAHQVLEVASKFGVKQVYTFAAALVSQFVEKPRIWATATKRQIISELGKQKLTLKGDFYISGMNGILLSVAKEMGMDGVCLLGETPRFLGEISNPAASKAILAVLTRLLGIEVDLGKLENKVQKFHREMEKFIEESRREFIDHFTFPLWERPEEEDKN
jgi:hypothetical protein